jgi:tRNA nucleotidyltransferase/poly(A) polymerase
MPDYIYLLKNRLSIHQQNALSHIRTAAREAGMTVFLVGGAVRDLTSGSPVLDLDVTVQGNALKLKKPLEKAGGKLWGEHEPSRTLFFRFPVGVTVEISSARREEYPKPGKPVYHWDTILDDLRRRDFTANAMALSLNEHSYGLLMDPLNGVADIEARLLRLVSN